MNAAEASARRARGSWGANKPVGLDSRLAIEEREDGWTPVAVARDTPAAVAPVTAAPLAAEILRLALERAKVGDVADVCALAAAFATLTSRA
jgi:hypothetical protein